MIIIVIIFVWLMTKKKEEEEEEGERKEDYIELTMISEDTNQIFFSAYNQLQYTVTNFQIGYTNWLTSITFLYTGQGSINKTQYESIKEQIEDAIVGY